MNRLYIKVCGALMRETEVDGYNGVIWYLLGAWAVLRFCPKDIGAMSVILLSWCDTAASTFGRLWGRYTPRIRKGKSLAGSLAAMVVGVLSAAWFWGYLAPSYGAIQGWDSGEWAFAYQGSLTLPMQVKGLLGWKETEGGGGLSSVGSCVVPQLSWNFLLKKKFMRLPIFWDALSLLCPQFFRNTLSLSS